jgi:hypothetical protein
MSHHNVSHHIRGRNALANLHDGDRNNEALLLAAQPASNCSNRLKPPADECDEFVEIVTQQPADAKARRTGISPILPN